MPRVTLSPEPIAALAKRRFQLLFVFLLAYLVLYPYVQDSQSEYIGFRAFGFGVTLLSVYAVSFRRSAAFAALVLAIPTAIHRVLLPAQANLFGVFGVALAFGFDVLIVIVIFRRVFREGSPDTEAVFGALCIYLLLGFSFAGLYSLLSTVQAKAFYLDPVANGHSLPNRFDLVYYSFGTMTSLGAAGITPVSDQARSLSVIEAILGVLYLAVLISRLVNGYHHAQVEKGLQNERLRAGSDNGAALRDELPGEISE